MPFATNLHNYKGPSTQHERLDNIAIQTTGIPTQSIPDRCGLAQKHSAVPLSRQRPRPRCPEPNHRIRNPERSDISQASLFACAAQGESSRGGDQAPADLRRSIPAQARHEQPSSDSSPMDTRGARGELVRALGKPNHCMPLKYHAKPDPKSTGSSEVQLNQVKSNQTVRNKIAPSYLDAAVPAAHPRSGRGASCQRPSSPAASAVGPRQRPWRRIVHAMDRSRGRHGRQVSR
jgi:hypothetical protein